MRTFQKAVTALFVVAVATASGTGFAQPADSDHLSLHTLFGANELASNINPVRRKAAAMPDNERYEYLKNWVLPSESHPDFRIVGEFTPADPSPPAIALEPHRFPTERGSEPVSPVFDLLDVASELGRLDDLYAEVSLLSGSRGDADARAKLVLSALVSLAQERHEQAGELVTRLHQRLDEAFKNPQSDYSAELLLLYDAVARKRALELVGDLLVAFHDNRHALDIADEWVIHLCTLVGHYREHLDGEAEGREVRDETFKNWIPVARSIAMTRGKGYPATIWQRRPNGELHLRSGHHRDYLFFRSPLAGSYEVAGEIDLGGKTQLMTSGLFVGPQGGRKSIEVGKFRTEHLVQPVDPPFAPHDPWLRYRAVVRDGHLKVFLNERLLVERQLGPNFDPWIAARGLAQSTGSLRHVQIAGEPQVAERVDLTSQAAFTSWYTYYFYTEDAGNPQSIWQWEAGESGRGEIVARRHPAPRGSWLESVLRYHRPLVEDGSVEYEFFYSPGDFHVHPALDRLAFLLQPEGVGLHWCTDGKFDRTAVSPDHVIFEEQSQRGSRPLPLLPGTWNRMKVSLAGQTVSLTLNGRFIFQYELPDSNLRTFGFFRYADRTMSRIRGVTMRGDWPKSVPPVAGQELADPRLAALHEDMADLPAEFRHDFVRDGLPDKYFNLTGRQHETAVTEEPDGVHVKLNGDSGWTVAALMPRFRLSGDFDIRAEFELQDLETSWQNGLAFLEIRLADDENHYFRAMRGHERTSGHSVRSQVLWGPHGGRRQLTQERAASWAPAGCLRIARAGDRLTALFAPEGSSAFRVLGQQEITTADVPIDGVLLELALRDASQGHVIWKNLSIRAEQLKYLEPGKRPIRKLFAMNPDGTNLRELTAPKFGLDHLGSPEFSADGDRIVMDMSKGPVSTSHVVIMNRDGSDMKDLGTGCMPSLSQDGKAIVFSDSGAGVMRMDADGENRKTIERSAWGVQYSPDGKRIAYGSGSNITLMDANTEKKTPLFEGELANRYSRVYWNFGWSHDSQAIAFKGRVRATGRQELAVVDISKPDEAEVLYSGDGIYEDFTFSPDSQSVLFALRQEGPTQPDLYLAHRRMPGEIERLEGQPDDYRILDCDWSPDGKEIVFAALVDPIPVDWPLQNDASETIDP